MGRFAHRRFKRSGRTSSIDQPVTSLRPVVFLPAQPLPFPLSRSRCSSLLFSTRMPVSQFYPACLASFSQILPPQPITHLPLPPSQPPDNLNLTCLITSFN